MRYHLTNHVLILTTYAALYISEQNTTDIWIVLFHFQYESHILEKKTTPKQNLINNRNKLK